MLPPVRQLFPIPVDDIDAAELYRADERNRERWLLVNMITSVDGAISIDGRSGGLGSPADKDVFHVLRGLADTILVGAGTARAENYGPPKVAARLAIVSGSLRIEPDARVFSGDVKPIVFTTTDSDPERRSALDAVSEVIPVGTGTVDLRAALAHLRGVVVCEGGPTLNGQLVAAGLVDELCLSVAPLLVSGASERMAHGDPPAVPVSLQLARVLEADGLLLLRYVNAASVPSPSSTG